MAEIEAYLYNYQNLLNHTASTTIIIMFRTNQSSRRLALILLTIILFIAAGLRFYNINWDNGIFAHPDERSTAAFYAPTIHWPDDLSTLLDPKKSTLNPFWDIGNQTRRSYTYGHFPLYVLVIVANLLHSLSSLPLEFPSAITEFLNGALSTHGFVRIGRALVALADFFTVYLLFLLGQRLYGTWGGLLAAALSAFTVLQIQLAHFFAVDPVSTTFTLLAIYGAVLIYEQQSTRAAIITGLGVGLAVASKFSALPIALAPVLASYLAILHYKNIDLNKPASNRKTKTQLISLAVLALAISFVVFAVTSPFVLLDFANFKRAVLEEQGNMVAGVADMPFTRQYRNTPSYWYFIEQQLRWGMGWPLGLLAFGGLLWAMGKAVTGYARPGEWIILGWLVPYFGFTGLFLAKFMRYMSPVVPLVTLLGAGLIIALWRMNRKITKTASVIFAAVALSGAVIWSAAFVNGVYGSEHSWVTFSRWVYANVPDSSCIAYEHWDDRLPTDIPEPGGNAGLHNYYQPQLPMYENDTQQKYELLRATLLNCDYIVLATNRLWRTIPRLPERYPMSTLYYQALFSGELGFEQIYSVETAPQLGRFVFDDQPADESFTVYDHPKPILFKKERQLPIEEWDAILGDSWQGAITGYVGKTTLLMRLRGASVSPPPPSVEDKGQSLALKSPVDKLPVVNDFRWNSAANKSTVVAVISWWLLVFFLGLVAFPLTFLLFNNLPDRGYALSKSLSILLVGYFVWITSSIGVLYNSVTTAIAAIIIMGGFSIWAFLSHRQQLKQFWHKQKLLILITEAVFIVIYLFFVYLRIRNPDLWQPWLGGEKMLEIGFLNAVVKSAVMPPYDPYFAGYIINYYYYGLFLVGVLIKLTGIEPTTAFNLAVPTLAALTAVNIFSLTRNLSLVKSKNRRVRSKKLQATLSGLLGILFVLFIGNLEGTAQFLRDMSRNATSNFNSAIPGLETAVLAVSGLGNALSANNSIIAYNYWDPTRVIPQTINEFPYFSFLFADLHPHMIGLPFTVLFLSLAYNWMSKSANQRMSESANQRMSESANQQISKSANEQIDESTNQQIGKSANEQIGESANQRIDESANQRIDESANQRISSQLIIHNSQFTINSLRWLALPFVLGAVAAVNTWDMPTYLGLMLAVFLLNRYRNLKAEFTMVWGATLLVKGILFVGALLAVSYLLYLPFFTNYKTVDVGLGLVHTKTALGQHLKIWGFFIFILLSWLWLSLSYPFSRNSLLRFISLFLRRWNVWPHLSEIYKQVVTRQSDGYQAGLWSLGLVILATISLFLLGYRTPAYLLPLMAIALLLLFRTEANTETAYLGLLIFTGLLVLFGVEFFFLRDFLGGGDYYRMNTLFKFFIQVWVMFGIAAAVALPKIWVWGWNRLKQMVWQGAAMILLLASLVYPIMATPVRLDNRFVGENNRPPIGTLDGLAYMSVGTFDFEWPYGSGSSHQVQLKYDYEAIRWLQNNVVGTPIIAEAKIGYYREGGMRVAAYTGLPSIMGGLHQNEQHFPSQLAPRDMMVTEFWTTPDSSRTVQLIQTLNISYIYIGQIERIVYSSQVQAKFEQLRQQKLLELVYENPETKIYRFVE